VKNQYGGPAHSRLNTDLSTSSGDHGLGRIPKPPDRHPSVSETSETTETPEDRPPDTSAIPLPAAQSTILATPRPPSPITPDTARPAPVVPVLSPDIEPERTPLEETQYDEGDPFLLELERIRTATRSPSPVRLPHALSPDTEVPDHPPSPPSPPKAIVDDLANYRRTSERARRSTFPDRPNPYSRSTSPSKSKRSISPTKDPSDTLPVAKRKPGKPRRSSILDPPILAAVPEVPAQSVKSEQPTEEGEEAPAVVPRPRRGGPRRKRGSTRKAIARGASEPPATKREEVSVIDRDSTVEEEAFTAIQEEEEKSEQQEDPRRARVEDVDSPYTLEGQEEDLIAIQAQRLITWHREPVAPAVESAISPTPYFQIEINEYERETSHPDPEPEIEEPVRIVGNPGEEIEVYQYKGGGTAELSEHSAVEASDIETRSPPLEELVVDLQTDTSANQAPEPDQPVLSPEDHVPTELPPPPPSDLDNLIVSQTQEVPFRSPSPLRSPPLVTPQYGSPERQPVVHPPAPHTPLARRSTRARNSISYREPPLDIIDELDEQTANSPPQNPIDEVEDGQNFTSSPLTPYPDDTPGMAPRKGQTKKRVVSSPSEHTATPTPAIKVDTPVLTPVQKEESGKSEGSESDLTSIEGSQQTAILGQLEVEGGDDAERRGTEEQTPLNDQVERDDLDSPPTPLAERSGQIPGEVSTVAGDGGDVAVDMSNVEGLEETVGNLESAVPVEDIEMGDSIVAESPVTSQHRKPSSQVILGGEEMMDEEQVEAMQITAPRIVEDINVTMLGEEEAPLPEFESDEVIHHAPTPTGESASTPAPVMFEEPPAPATTSSSNTAKRKRQGQDLREIQEPSPAPTAGSVSSAGAGTKKIKLTIKRSVDQVLTGEKPEKVEDREKTEEAGSIPVAVQKKKGGRPSKKSQPVEPMGSVSGVSAPSAAEGPAASIAPAKKPSPLPVNRRKSGRGPKRIEDTPPSESPTPALPSEDVVNPLPSDPPVPVLAAPVVKSKKPGKGARKSLAAVTAAQNTPAPSSETENAVAMEGDSADLLPKAKKSVKGGKGKGKAAAPGAKDPIATISTETAVEAPNPSISKEVSAEPPAPSIMSIPSAETSKRPSDLPKIAKKPRSPESPSTSAAPVMKKFKGRRAPSIDVEEAVVVEKKDKGQVDIAEMGAVVEKKDESRETKSVLKDKPPAPIKKRPAPPPPATAPKAAPGLLSSTLAMLTQTTTPASKTDKGKGKAKDTANGVSFEFCLVVRERS
jgi:hypothetical protein